MSNALHTLCKMFLESYVPGIQTLKMYNSNIIIVGVALSASK